MYVKKSWAVLVLPFFSVCFGMQDGSGDIKSEWLTWCRSAIKEAHFDDEQACTAVYAPDSNSKYIIVTGSLFKGKREFVGIDRPCLRTIHNVQDQKSRRIRNMKAQLAGEYKIHLMPADAQEMKDSLEELINLLKTNSDFQNSMFRMKFHAGITNQMTSDQILKVLTDSRGNIAPLMVLYPARGKEHAQNMLDLVQATLSDKKGFGQTPRFNHKFSNFLFASQGEGSEKDGNFSCHFQSPDRIYYRSDWEGVQKDYQLRSPIRKSNPKRLKGDD